MINLIPMKFVRNDDGALTVFGLFLAISMLVVGGLGIDVANAYMIRTQLQVAADSAAHAALVARDLEKSPTEAKDIAVAIAQRALPTSRYGDSINADDITFGKWNASTRVFTPDATSKDAVLVNTQRLASRRNAVVTYFLRFINMYHLDVVRQSVFETYYPTCFREGFVAENRVDVQSNNVYGNGFCIHSNDHVEINNGNSFLDGSIVSMPDSADLVVPSGGMDSNPGLSSALRSGAYRLRILDQMDDIIAGVEDPDSPYFETDYVNIDPITGQPVERVTLDSKGVNLGDWKPGAIHTLDCMSPKKQVGFGKPNDVFKKGVLVTNCIIKFGSSVAIEDIIIINSNTDLDSFTGAAGFTLGRDDGCAAGGGSQLITDGGVNFPADLQIYGGQIIARKLVTFAARPDGIEGVSIISGDQIDGSSLINVGFCGGSGMDNNFMAAYFRLAT